MNGLLLVDKPGGLTSFDVVRRIRRLCATRRVGHCGTLDPLATGVLPVAVGTATRLVEYLMAGDKVYEAVLRLGVVTDTQDATGAVLAEASYAGVTLAAVEESLAALTGTILQLPPMYSAIKQHGTPLYKLARQGVDVAREPRAVEIRGIELLSYSPPLISLRVNCGKGTYIRTVCHDLGQRLGCGAHLTALRRTRCGAFDAGRCLSPDALEALASNHRPLPWLSCAEALADWPTITVSPVARERLANGVPPRAAEVEGLSAVTPGAMVALQLAGTLAAIATYAPERGGEGRPGDFTLIKVFPEAFSPP